MVNSKLKIQNSKLVFIFLVLGAVALSGCVMNSFALQDDALPNETPPPTFGPIATRPPRPTPTATPLVLTTETPLSAESSPTRPADVTPTSSPGPSTTPSPTPEAWPYALADERALHSSVCFEYLVRQTNRIFIINTPFEHIAFYNEVDESELCRFAVTRNPFDFETGRIIVGAINVGNGCTAKTDLLEVVTDDEMQAVILRVQWGVEGACPYRLVRPFWVSLDRLPDGYRIALEFVPLPEPTPTVTPPGVGG